MLSAMKNDSANKSLERKRSKATSPHGKVGIFWVYRGTVLGRPVKLEAGEAFGEFIDSPEGHVHVWEETNGFSQQFPELAGRDYETVPRGRVLFNCDEKQFVVYLDSVLMNDETKVALKTAFSLEDADCTFLADSHYTTDPDAIRRMFE